MFNLRKRAIITAVVSLAVIWLAAVAGYQAVQHAKVTPDKVRAYVASLDFSHLSPEERAAAIAKLAAMLNALTLEERQALRLDHTAYKWFAQMTQQEKKGFLDATMPTGFKQTITAFENLPSDKRQRAVNQAMKQMKEAREKMAATGELPPPGTNDVALSQDLQDEVTKIGLQSFYSQSSPEARAELAPFMEELQHTMESGRMLRGQRQP